MSKNAGGTVKAAMVRSFFKYLKESHDDGGLNEECLALIKKEPKLLECQCPKMKINNELEDWVGKTATECMCRTFTPASRDTLLELVEAGAMATDTCYDLVLGEEMTMVDHLEVLLLSGYMPTMKHWFLLDESVENCDEPEFQMDGIMKILHGKVQAGDNLSCGDIKPYLVEKIANLPKLEVGVTHIKNGPFAECQKEWLNNNEKEDCNEEEDETSTEETEKPAKKKRRR